MSDIVTFSAEIDALFKETYSLSNLSNKMCMRELCRLPPI